MSYCQQTKDGVVSLVPRKAQAPRPHLNAMLTINRPERRLAAGYDAARTTDEFKNYWANADCLDADSANSRDVRQTLVSRSRYESESNGHYNGILGTYATALVGTGPKLRLLTKNTTFNQQVEREWAAWAKQVQLRRKLWCMALARVKDGEPFAILQTNPRLRHAVKLDLALIETEQCQSPYLAYGVAGKIDGITFDQFGNPATYDILPFHPGSSAYHANPEPEPVAARNVIHWFKLERPGQHRGVPACSSTLNTGASSRRFREATVAAAETAADIAALIHSGLNPSGDDEADQVQPLTSVEMKKRAMVTLPHGWTATQMRAEHPAATYESFTRAQLQEQARPLSMPYSLAACDSSNANFASAKLDALLFWSAIDVEREDANDLVLDRIFEAWFLEWSVLGGEITEDGFLRPAPPHAFDWPVHPPADVKAEAAATDTNLRNGSIPLSRVYSDAGFDFQDELQTMAGDYGVTPDEMRRILLHTHYPAAAGAVATPAEPDTESPEVEEGPDGQPEET